MAPLTLTPVETSTGDLHVIAPLSCSSYTSNSLKSAGAHKQKSILCLRQKLVSWQDDKRLAVSLSLGGSTAVRPRIEEISSSCLGGAKTECWTMDDKVEGSNPESDCSFSWLHFASGTFHINTMDEGL